MGQLLKLLCEFLYEVISELLKIATIESFKDATWAGLAIGFVLLTLFAVTRRS